MTDAEKAARYDKLTQALHALIEQSGWYGISIGSTGVFWQPSGEAIADHDGTPDGIADAIISTRG